MKKRLYYNSFISLLYQICSVIVGLIIPRLILGQYGSEVNGLVTSISQFLSVISLMDLGVGAVVQSALYKPLAEKDNNRISVVYSAAERYFRTIAKILLGYIVILCVYYGLFKNETYSWPFTTTLILALSVDYFSRYYFGICNSLLLNADQRIYVVTLVNLYGLFANAIATVILLNAGAGIQLVKLASSCIFLTKPLILKAYVSKNYNIVKIRKLPRNAIPNMWNGLAQHITVTVANSIDNILLTIFGTFTMISIYNVYVLPLTSIRTLIDTTSNSYKSFFGNLIARSEEKKLQIEFSKYETMMHFIASAVMSTCMVVLVPFVLVYTKNVSDANYRNDAFCMTIVIAYVMYILRIIYTNVIFAAGKFKETQSYCVIECVLNLLISLILVRPFGIVGVAFGTVVSAGYRMFASAYYLKKDILKRKLTHLYMHLITDVMCFCGVFFISKLIRIETPNFFWLVIYASVMFFLSIAVCIAVHFVAYRKQMLSITRTVINKLKHVPASDVDGKYGER